MISSSSGVLVADIHGSVHLLNRDFEPVSSWIAHVDGRVTHMVERKDVLVTLGVGALFYCWHVINWVLYRKRTLFVCPYSRSGIFKPSTRRLVLQSSSARPRFSSVTARIRWAFLNNLCLSISSFVSIGNHRRIIWYPLTSSHWSRRRYSHPISSPRPIPCLLQLSHISTQDTHCSRISNGTNNRTWVPRASWRNTELISLHSNHKSCSMLPGFW